MTTLCAGKLDRRITLKRHSYGLDGRVPTDSYQMIAENVAASKEELQGYERFVNDRNLADSEVEFRIRWSNAVKALVPADIIVHGDAEYDIVSVQEIGRRVGLAIKAKRRDVNNNG